jgi:WD40 repeat protein
VNHLKASYDETLRLWSLDSFDQLAEFTTPQEIPVFLVYGPTEFDHQIIVVCGFQNGFVRVFDFDSIEILFEYQQHSGCISDLLYSINEHYLFSG